MRRMTWLVPVPSKAAVLTSVSWYDRLVKGLHLIKVADFCHFVSSKAKASKRMHQVCIENHMTSTYTYIRAVNSSTGCTGFVKCFDIAVFCFILNQAGQL